MKLSIITVTYNSGATIRDTLASVAEQSYPHIEHIIVDNLSTDNTLSIVAEFPHVTKVISEKDAGIYDAMNKGVQVCSGDIIGILNSDDVYQSKETLANVMNAFGTNAWASAVYGHITYFNTENPELVVRLWKSRRYHDHFFESGEVPPHPSLFLRKEVYEVVKQYHPYFKISSDYELMLRAFKIHKFKPFLLDQVIVRMRNGGMSTKGWKNTYIGNREIMQSWRMNHLPLPILLFPKRIIKKIMQLVVRH